MYKRQAFITGDKYPTWENNLLVGSLKFQQIQRLELQGDTVTHTEILLDGIGRVRALEMGTDGFIYIAVESGGRIIRLAPKL